MKDIVIPEAWVVPLIAYRFDISEAEAEQLVKEHPYGIVARHSRYATMNPQERTAILLRGADLVREQSMPHWSGALDRFHERMGDYHNLHMDW